MDEGFASKGKIGEVSRMLLQDLSTPEHLGKMLKKGALPSHDYKNQKRYSMTKAVGFREGEEPYTLIATVDIQVTRGEALGEADKQE